MGKAGAPIGNKNAVRAKIWTEAVRKALAEVDPKTKRKRLDLVARRLVVAALDGDVAAMKEIGDRIEGKPAQPVENGERAFQIEVVQTVVGAD